MTKSKIFFVVVAIRKEKRPEKITTKILPPGRWIWENLKNLKKFSKTNIFFSLKNANFNQRSNFPVYFLSILDIFYRTYFFDLKLAREMGVIIEWGPGGKI